MANQDLHPTAEAATLRDRLVGCSMRALEIEKSLDHARYALAAIDLGELLSRPDSEYYNQHCAACGVLDLLSSNLQQTDEGFCLSAELRKISAEAFPYVGGPSGQRDQAR